MQTRTSSRLGLAFLVSLFLVAVGACGGSGGPTPFESLEHEVPPLPTPPPPPPGGTPVDGTGTPPAGPAGGTLVPLDMFEKAKYVIGQPDFVSFLENRGAGFAPSANSLRTGGGISASTDLWVNDEGNNRVLRFPLADVATDPDANRVLGQPDFFSSDSSGGPEAMNSPADVDRSGSRVIVTDSRNNRIMIWNTVPTLDGADADILLGPHLNPAPGGSARLRLSSPRAAHVVSGETLFVADTLNHRVLIWWKFPKSSTVPADLVLGQADFATGTPGAGRAKFNRPMDLWADENCIAVADWLNHRVLIWTSMPTKNGQKADLVLGQTSLTSQYSTTEYLKAPGHSLRHTLGYPIGITSNGTQLMVSNMWANRVDVWDTFPTENGQLPDRALGQSNWFNNTARDDNQNGVDDGFPSSRTFSGVQRLAILRGRLFVGDLNRVLVFE